MALRMDAENTYQVFDWLCDIWPTFGARYRAVTCVYVQIPVLWEKPELSQLDQFFGVLRLYEGRKVWVHCAKNMRVSTFVYLYRRLCRGEREEMALPLMQKVWVPNDVWQAFISHALHVHSNSSLEADGADAPQP